MASSQNMKDKPAKVALVNTDRRAIIEGLTTAGLLFVVNTVALREGSFKKAGVHDLLVAPLSLLAQRVQDEADIPLLADQPWRVSLTVAALSTAVSLALPDELAGPWWFNFIAVAASHSVARLVGKQMFDTGHLIKERYVLVNH